MGPFQPMIFYDRHTLSSKGAKMEGLGIWLMSFPTGKKILLAMVVTLVCNFFTGNNANINL